MKKQIKSYISFTRLERTGLIMLCAIIIILIGFRACMFLCIDTHNIEKEKELTAAWNIFRQNSTETKTDKPAQNESGAKNTSDKQLKFSGIININKADSATLVSLKGIGPATASRILARRNTIGPFTDIEQLLEIPHFPKAYFNTLKPHLSIDDNGK